MKIIPVLLLLFSLALNSQAQEDKITFKTGKYILNAEFDTATYCTNFVISFGDFDILTECTDRITEIKEMDVEGKGEKLLIISFYTGGAHCCSYMTAALLKDGSYKVKDTLWWGDSGCEIKDIDKDKKVEFSGYDTRYAYAFTNFAQSRFPIIIYQFRNGKFVEVTKKFPDLVEKDIKELKKELTEEYLKKGFACPTASDEETFNTDAGAVKAILAPIVQDYHYLGETEEGYDYVGKVYKCKDVNKFIKTLKEDYKLK